MPPPVAFDITLAPLPVNFEGTPQEFAQAMVDRLTITPAIPWSSFITGSVIPTSDNGPLLYNSGSGNKEWRVWDTGTGAYTYLTVNGAGLVAGSVPISKFATDLANASSVFTLNSSGVPTFKTGSLGDTLRMGASGPEFQTTVPLTFAPVRATAVTVPQSVPIDTVLHKIIADSELFDPQSVYDAVNSRYVAPTTGIYAVSASVQVDNNGGVQADMEIAIGTSINGNPVLATRISSGTSVPSPSGERWYPQCNGLIALTAGDQLEIYMSAQDGVNGANVDVSNVQLSYHRIQ
jgi:hypothetical protein